MLYYNHRRRDAPPGERRGESAFKYYKIITKKFFKKVLTNRPECGMM
jgi:hypothetical protein